MNSDDMKHTDFFELGSKYLLSAERGFLLNDDRLEIVLKYCSKGKYLFTRKFTEKGDFLVFHIDSNVLEWRTGKKKSYFLPLIEHTHPKIVEWIQSMAFSSGITESLDFKVNRANTKYQFMAVDIHQSRIVMDKEILIRMGIERAFMQNEFPWEKKSFLMGAS